MGVDDNVRHRREREGRAARHSTRHAATSRPVAACIMSYLAENASQPGQISATCAGNGSELFALERRRWERPSRHTQRRMGKRPRRFSRRNGMFQLSCAARSFGVWVPREPGQIYLQISHFNPSSDLARVFLLHALG